MLSRKIFRVSSEHYFYRRQSLLFSPTEVFLQLGKSNSAGNVSGNAALFNIGFNLQHRHFDGFAIRFVIAERIKRALCYAKRNAKSGQSIRSRLVFSAFDAMFSFAVLLGAISACDRGIRSVAS
nr:MAG TPA: hypothetical protein [Caudoviricetes sp.]